MLGTGKRLIYENGTKAKNGNVSEKFYGIFS